MDNRKELTLFVHIIPQSESITRVVYSYEKECPASSALISESFKPQGCLMSGAHLSDDNCISFKNRQGDVILRETERSLTEKEVYRYFIDGEPIIKRKQTANGEVATIENAREEPAGTSFEGRLVFFITENEGLYGLGQHEDGVYNYNGKKEYLYQTNMKISIPFILSTWNYGILLDTESTVIFDGKQGEITFTIDTTREISYYVITGDSFEEIIRDLRRLTGGTPMLPRWAYGYIQSRERYKSSEELISTVRRFRASGIPIDCIVQDWLSWGDGLWGEKRADKTRFPDLNGLVRTLHGENVKLMVSIWPNMAKESSHFAELNEKGMLLPNSTTYDAFSEEARAVYWKQCEEEWFSAGIDAWWCDNAEIGRAHV